MRLSSPSLLVDINGVAGLDGIAVKNGMVEIGAMTRHVTLERSSDIAKHAPLIALAMPHIAHPAIRNRGTIGGSLAYADPAAELPACLVALDGEIDIAGPKRQAQREGRRLLQGPVRDRARTARRAERGALSGGRRADTRVGFAELARRPRRLRAWSGWRRPRRRTARLERRTARLFRRRRDAGAGAQGRSSAGARLGRRRRQGARSRSRPATSRRPAR